jgi:hypothetical protein
LDNSTLDNSTLDNSTLADSATPYISHFERRCPETDAVTFLFGFLSYHLANALLALAFIVPKSAKLSTLAVRGIATAGIFPQDH